MIHTVRNPAKGPEYLGHHAIKNVDPPPFDLHNCPLLEVFGSFRFLLCNDDSLERLLLFSPVETL